MTHGPRLTQIERIAPPTVDEFRRRYDEPGLPVVIEGGMAGWPALGRWSHEWFKATHGAVPVALSVNPTHTSRIAKTTMADYVDMILADKKMGGGLYASQFDLDGIPGLEADLVRPPYLPDDRKILSNLWIGPGSTVVSFHKDHEKAFDKINNIFAQVYGRKRIVLAAPTQDARMYPRPIEVGAYWHSQIDFDRPDHARFPRYQDAELLETTVGPGDLLFIPGDYWHYVRALERSVSVSFWWRPSLLAECVIHLALAIKDQALDRFVASRAGVVQAHDVEVFGGIDRLRAELAPYADTPAYPTLLAALQGMLAPELRSLLPGPAR